MKECSLCQRARLDDNLWCQEKRCPAEDAPLRLRAGDRMGFIAEKPLATLRERVQTDARQ